MTHLYIEQNTGLTEEVNSSIISKLYELAISGDLDNTSDLKGRLHSTSARDIHVAYLNETFDDLYINADTLYITFVDPEVERVLATKYGDGTNVTTNDMSSVTSINYDDGFNENTTITQFPELKKFTNLINLNTFAFSNTSNLTTIDLTNIQHIGGQAFYGSGITGVINLPNIVSFGDGARNDSFKLCTNITEVNIGPNFNNDTQYMREFFSDCTSLQKVTGLSNITSIPYAMFNYCTSLTSVDIDWTKITSIDSIAFRYSAITGSLTLSSLTSIGGNYETGAFKGCVGITQVDLSGSTITSMEGTFRDCTNLASVTLPNTLQTVGSNCFYNTKLQSIDLKNVAYVKGSSFQNTKLTSIDLSNIVDVLGMSVFQGCTNLTSVTFPSTSFDWFSDTPNQISASNKYAFLKDCTSLTSVDLSNAQSLGQSMFSNDSALTTITLSASNITNIPNEFCYHCSNLSSLGNKITPTYIGDRAFEGCTQIDNNDIDLSAATYIGNSAMKNTAISGVLNLTECLTLGENPFNGCTGITEIHAPKVTDINAYHSWNQYSNLEVLDLPVSTRINYVQNNPKLTTINAPLATKFSTYNDGRCSFANCPLLSTLNINFSAVTTLGNSCFYNDAGLNGQYLYFPNVTSFESEALKSNAINFVFANNSVITLTGYGWFSNYTGTVYVPDNLVNTYKTTSEWSSIANQIKGISELPQS